MNNRVKPSTWQAEDIGAMLDPSQVLQPVFLISILTLFLISLNMVLHEWD